MGCKTFEEAVENQRKIHAQVDAGEWPGGLSDSWRWQSLHDDYEMKPVLHYGTGYYPVNKKTGDVCEWQGRWSDKGDVLLCTECFLDGT